MDSTDSLPTEAGNYYLTGNVNLGSVVWDVPSGETKICLNGKELKAKKINIASGNTLTISDCGETGTVKRNGGLVQSGTIVENAGTFNLYGGSITGNTNWYGYGGGVINNGTFNMYGGAVTRNSADRWGGGVDNESGATFNLYGGSITKNSGGTGGGLYNLGKFNMYGGEITGNKTDMDSYGGIYSANKINISGKVVINGNTNKNGDPSNYCSSSNGAVMIVGALEEGSSIGVTRYKDIGIITTGGDEYIDCFFSDNAQYFVEKDGENLKLSEKEFTVTVTSSNITHGTASANKNSGTKGTQVRLTAEPVEGYRLKEWKLISGGGTLYQSGIFYIGTENAEIQAVFEQVTTYTVQFNADGGTGSKDSVTVFEGDSYILPANPFTAPTGKQFKAWSVGDKEYAVGNTITVSADTTVTAVWENIPAEEPTVQVSDNLTLTYGEFTGQKFTATVDKKDGYSYEYQWIDNNQVIGRTETLTIPDDLTAGFYDYALAVIATRNDNGEKESITIRDIWVKVNAKVLDVANIKLSKNEFIYNGQEQKPTVTVKDDDGCQLTENYDYTLTWPTDCKNAGDKTVTVNFEGNYSGNMGMSFTINKASYDMSGAKWNYNAAFDYDGKEKIVEVIGLPDGVSVSGYESNKATVVGDYTAKVTFDYDSDNYNTPVLTDRNWSIKNDWTPTEYNVSTPNGNGWLNDEFTITPAEGYLVSLTDTADGTWSDTLTYTEETEDGNVTFYLKNETDGTISLAKTVTYKLDKTPANGKVEFVERTSWQEFVNAITFGLFYNTEVTVKAEATDALSQVASIEYAVADKAMTLDEVAAITDWTVMPESGVAVTVEDAKQFVYFVRITDKAGNETYLSTNGAEYDTTAPHIEGVANDGIYYVTQKVTVTDKNLNTVTLNGTPVTLDGNGSFMLAGNTEAEYQIVATDKAGNSTVVTVTMKAISAMKAPIDDKTTDNVSSADGETVQSVIDHAAELLNDTDITDSEKAELETVKETAEALKDKIGDTAAESTDITDAVGEYDPATVTSGDAQDVKDLIDRVNTLLDGENLTEDEKAALEETKKAAQDLLDKLDEAANADDTENTEKVKDVTAETVTPENKADLEKAKEDLAKTLDDYADNLTEDEKTAIKDEIDRIDEALAVVQNVEAVEARIGDLPKTITKNDEAAIQAAEKAYNTLSDYERSLVDKNVKQALDDAKAALAELSKPTDSTTTTGGTTTTTENVPAPGDTPDTGDSGNLRLWFALLFVSGAGLFGAVIRKKKQRES